MRPDRFGPPRLPDSVLVRPRLLDALAARFAVRIVTVEGGPGFGKTTLLAQAIAENARHGVGRDIWLGCEAGDAAASALGRDLAVALGIDRAAAQPDEIADLVWGLAPTPVAFVLDDVHLVPEGSEGADLLAELLETLPENGHLVVAGRAPLPLATTRLLAQGRAVRIDETQLRLTGDELAAVAREHGLAGDALDATGGWPALAGLGAAAGPDAAHRFVLEEVYAALPDRSRESLAALCFLGGGDATLLAPALGRPVDLGAELGSVPLVAHHDDGWFRPHALWEPITAGVLDDGAVAALRRGAARVLEDRGDLAGAADLLLVPPIDDDDWELARELVAHACQLGNWVHHGSMVASWAHRLPSERRTEPAGQLLLAAAARHRRGDAEAEAPFEAARAAAQAHGDVPVELAALSHLGHLAWWRDDMVAGAAICARADELARAGWAEAEPIARFGHAMLAEIMGDHAGALREAAGVDRGALSDLLASAADWLQARALVQLGRADEAIPIAARACTRAEFPAARTTWIVACYQSGRIDDALEIAAGVDPTSPSSPRDRVLFGVVLAAGYARLGRLDAARRAAAVARAERSAVAGTRVATMIELSDALVEVAEGDEAAAAHRARDALERPDDAAALVGLGAFLGLLVVLVPETRDVWASMPLGPDHRAARAAAERLVAARAGRPLPVDVPPVGQLVATLGIPWTVELAARTGDVALADACVRIAPVATKRRLHELAEDHATAAGARSLARAVPSPPSAPVVVRLLGPATIERDGRIVDDPDWRRERVRSLLGLLVTRARTTRGEVAAALWPDLDPEAAAGNLRVTLRYLHRVLEPERDPGSAAWYVRSRGEVLELVREMLIVDAWEMERLLDLAETADAESRAGDALAHLREALAWWGGDFAGDLDDEWIDLERGRLRARFLAGAVRTGELLLGRGAVDEALGLGTRAVQAEPWSEPAFRLVASAHLARGDRASARRTLERCRAMLDDLGVPADAETEMLWRRTVRGTGQPAPQR